MKIQKNIYITTMIVFIITILIISITTLLKNEEPVLLSKQQTNTQKELNQYIVSRDITPEVKKIQNFLDNADLPKDNGALTNIKKAVENAMDMWIEFQELVNSKKVNSFLVKNKMYMADYEDVVNKISYQMVFYSQKGELRQCTKKILYSEKNDNEIKTYYRLYFSDDFNIERYEDSNNEVYFYRSGAIKSIRYTTEQENTIINSIKWSEDGEIIRQRSYDKSQSNSLLLEAEEKAKQKLKKLQDNTKQDYEEYLKSINSENPDFNN